MDSKIKSMQSQIDQLSQTIKDQKYIMDVKFADVMSLVCERPTVDELNSEVITLNTNIETNNASVLKRVDDLN